MANEPEFLRIRNWEKYQVYKDGRAMLFFAVHVVSDPEKDRVGIFDDPAFLRLADDPRCPVFRMMGLATRTGNKIPNDPDWIARTCYSEHAIDVEKMMNSGFLEPYTEKPLISLIPPEQAVVQTLGAATEVCTNNRVEKSREEENKVVKDVYDHWRTTRAKSDPRYKRLSDNRRRKIVARLREFSAAELKRAIDAVALDPWEDRPRHDDLTIIFRSEEQVQKFLALADDPSVLDEKERLRRHFEGLGK